MRHELAPPLLHNMSGPPKSVVRFAGLSNLGPADGEAQPEEAPRPERIENLFGVPVRFGLPFDLGDAGPSQILTRLGLRCDASSDAEAESRLVALIEERAESLPLPDGCAVVPSNESHRVIWDEALTSLAILTKSSGSVWLRSKTPSLAAATRTQTVSLLVPTRFAQLLQEVER